MGTNLNLAEDDQSAPNRPTHRHTIPALVLSLMVAAALACNFAGQPASEPTLPVSSTTDLAGPTVTTQAPPSPTAAADLDLSGIDPCNLVTAEQVGEALGAEVDEIPPAAEDQVPATCGFSTPDFSAFVTIQLYQDPAGKRALLDLYGQLTGAQECSYSVSFTTADVTPTPLPAAVEAHVEKGLDEIYRMYWETNRQFCGEAGMISELTPWPELGPQAYTSKSLGGFLGASIQSGSVQILQPEAALVIQISGAAGVIDGDLLDRYNELLESDDADPAEIEEIGQQLFAQLDGLVEIAKDIARSAFSDQQ